MIRTLEFRKRTRFRSVEPSAITMNPDELLVILVRHGMTTEDSENKYCGWCDSEMTDEGRQEMQKVKPLLSGVPYGPVYTDDLRRTGEAAKILSEGATKSDVVVLRGLRSWGIGTELSGQVKTRSRERLVQYYVDNPNVVPEGDEAESINEGTIRWNSAFSYVLSQTKPGIASVLSVHSNAHKILRQQFLGQKYKGGNRRLSFKVGHGGVITFRLRKDGNAVIDVVSQGRLEENERSARIAEVRSLFTRQVEVSPDFVLLCNEFVACKYDDPRRREILLEMGRILKIPHLPVADVMSIIGSLPITHLDHETYVGEIEEILHLTKNNPSEKSPLK